MSTIYQRRDFAIRLFADGSDAVLTIASPEGTKWETRRPRSLIDRASAVPKELSDAVRKSVSASEVTHSQTLTLERVTVEVGVRDWAAMEWESIEVGGRLIVRTSPVRPRVLQIPITFPIRVLEVDRTPVVPAAMDATFHGSTARGNAYIDAHTALFDVESFARRESWATADILHVHDLRAATSLLTNAHDSTAGTTGWFLRFADRFQTRLIVLDGHQSVPPVLRRLAQTIIDRGGPAVLFLGNDPLASHTLYRDISHDRPLDWIHAGVAGSELFVGAGGEEALRYSVVARELSEPRIASSVKKAYVAHFVSPQKIPNRPSIDDAAIRSTIVESATEMGVIDAKGIRFDNLWGLRAQRFGHSLAAKLPQHGLVAIDLGSEFEQLRGRGIVLSVDDLAGYIVTKSQPFRSMNRRGAMNIFSTKIDDIVRSSAAYRYEDRESDGMLPLAAKIADVRSLVTAVRDPNAARPGRAPRHVNSAFYAVGSDGKLKKIPQPQARFKVGDAVHLGVQIGPKDELIVSLGPTSFLEEKVRWDGDGAWMEIGVTGIDFEVIGDPVQEFYLPCEGSSDLIAFGVRPLKPTTVPGVARLRFTIYHRDNAVQSFLVVAALEDAPRSVAPAMARALSVGASAVKKIGTAGYIARLEYGTTANIAHGAQASPRSLTIVANDSAGDKVTTIKGDDLFRVCKDDTSNVVNGARTTLEAASRRGAAYRYLYQNMKNAGDPRELCDVLSDIAYAGWRIYNALVPDPNDQDRIRSLIEKGDGIHAAHLDFSNVIPWSMIYDREVFIGKARPPSVCRASMPDANGNMPAIECGGAGCLLNKADNDDPCRKGETVYTEETVICPRRFWGFMFPIDVPAHKVDGLGEKSLELVEKIKDREPISVVAGYNEKLDFGTKHVTDLMQGILKKANVTRGAGRDAVRTIIKNKNNDPDIVYFYCHALAKTVTKEGKDLGSTLDFGPVFKGVGEDVLEDVLLPADFGGRPVWTHAPLIFINGCSTVGSSPYAPSEFIKQFVRGKHAAAVVGTETTIVEMLAIEAAESFLQELIAGKSSGDAMLRMRRLLLAKNNPLGLIYTLYGSARLKLVTAAAAGKT
jgi:hypothetical protein